MIQAISAMSATSLRALVVGSLLLAAACGSASTPEAEPVDDTVGRESTRTTERDREREDDVESDDDDEEASEFAEAPGIVAGDLLFGLAGDASTGILPRWYLEDPLVDPATDGVAVADDDVVTYASPDGRYVLLRRDPTAVVRGSYEVVDVRSGDVVSDFEHEGLQPAAQVAWSPDGAAVVVADEIASYLHRVDGQTTVITAGSGHGGGSFSNDESSTALAHCDGGGGSLVVATAGDDAAGVVEEQPHGGSARCRVTEVSDQDGNSVALVWYGPRSEEGDLEDGRLYRLAPDGELIETSQPGEDLAVPRSGSRACNDLVMVPSDGDTLGWVYSPEQDAFVSFEGRFDPSCVIPSPDGTAFAVVSQDDEPVLVGDFATGNAIEISRRGNPIAWSADSSQVLVEGNGTFVVDADGSDSSEASEQLAELGPSGAYCRAGETGLVLINDADSSGDRRLVLFDVGANESTQLPTPTEHLREHCSVTPDGRWLLTSSVLVDLENHDAMELPLVVADTGARVDDSDDPVQSLARFMWYGRQHLTDVKR